MGSQKTGARESVLLSRVLPPWVGILLSIQYLSLEEEA